MKYYFYAKPELYFEWILNFGNIAVVTKQNLEELALRKTQDAVIKCIKFLPPDITWNNFRAILHQQFSSVPTITHLATHLMHRCQQKGEGLQKIQL